MVLARYMHILRTCMFVEITAGTCNAGTATVHFQLCADAQLMSKKYDKSVQLFLVMATKHALSP